MQAMKGATPPERWMRKSKSPGGQKSWHQVLRRKEYSSIYGAAWTYFMQCHNLERKLFPK